MTAQQMQELCRELVGALNTYLMAGHKEARRAASVVAKAAVAKAEQAFNPTPAPTGCVETAATVPACVGTGETVKALGVGPACPVCGEHRMYVGYCNFICGAEFDGSECKHSKRLAITRAKQLADADHALRCIADLGGTNSNDGDWCADIAQDYLRNKPKEPTA